MAFVIENGQYHYQVDSPSSEGLGSYFAEMSGAALKGIASAAVVGGAAAAIAGGAGTIGAGVAATGAVALGASALMDENANGVEVITHHAPHNENFMESFTLPLSDAGGRYDADKQLQPANDVSKQLAQAAIQQQQGTDRELTPVEKALANYSGMKDIMKGMGIELEDAQDESASHGCRVQKMPQQRGLSFS